MDTKGSVGFCVLIAAALGGPLAAYAQDYPVRPVRLIVPLAPGGAMDTVARALAQKLTGNLKQTLVVDNRGGGGGSIGAELTMRATPDGYTLMMGSASYLIHALLYPAPYHPVRDFVPVTQVTQQPYVLVVHPAVPARTVSEFIAVARAKPGQFSFASAGSGSLIHLTTELFKALAGIDAVHVPFKGMGAAYPDLLSGRLQFAFGSIISATPHLKSGKLRGLGVTSRKRAASLPELPPLAEAGVPGFDVTQWYGLLVPLKTSRAVIARVQREVASVLQQPDVIARFAADGSEPVGSTSEEFSAHIRNEYERWSKVIKQAGIRAD